MSNQWNSSCNWFIIHEHDGYSVRRFVRETSGKRKNERLPRAQFARYRQDLPELEKFVARLNDRDLQAEKARENAAYRHAHIDEALLVLAAA